MKKFAQKIFAGFLSIIMIGSCFQLGLFKDYVLKANAASTMQYGNCGVGNVWDSDFGHNNGALYGSNLQWDLNLETGLMRIYGTGEMGDFYIIEVYQPWKPYQDYIKTVKIYEGVTSIGPAAFAFCDNLKTVYIPSTMSSYGSYCFYELKLDTVYYSGPKSSYKGPSASTIKYNCDKMFQFPSKGMLGNLVNNGEDMFAFEYLSLNQVVPEKMNYDGESLEILKSGYYYVNIDDCSLKKDDVMFFTAVPTNTDSYISAVHCNGVDALVEECSVPITDSLKDPENWEIRVYSPLTTIEKFQLISTTGNAVVSESSDGYFLINPKRIPIGSSLKVRAIDKNGTKYEPLKTNIKTYELKTLISLKDKGVNITLPEDLGILSGLLGGAEIDIDLAKLPFFVEYGDGVIRIGIGASESEKNDILAEFTSSTTKYDDKNNNWGDWKNLVNGWADDYENIKYQKSLLNNLNNGEFIKTGFQWKTSAKCYAYAEIAKSSSGNYSVVSANGYLSVSLSASKDWQTVAFGVPVVIGVNAKVGADCDVSVGYDFTNASWTLNSDILFTIPEITTSGGVGIAYLTNASAFIRVTNELFISFIDSYVRDILNGSFGLSGKFLMFEGEKEFYKWDGVELFYTSWDETMLMTQSVVDEKVVSVSNENLYDIKSYDLEKREHLSKQSSWYNGGVMSTQALTDVISPQLLQSSIYESATPKIVSTDDGLTVMVWTADIKERTSGNHTAVVFSVYDNDIGVWSEPRIVYDDATADFNPDISTDGNEIYVVWMNSNTTFDESVNTNECASACEIVLSKFDKQNSQFQNPVEITTNNSYDFLPSVAVVDGIGYVSFVENSGDNPLMQTGGNIIFIVSSDGINVKSFNKVCEISVPVDQLCVGYFGNTVYSIFTIDGDGDVLTSDDIEIYSADINGTVNKLTTSVGYEHNLKISNIDGNSCLTYILGNKLHCSYDLKNHEIINFENNSVCVSDYQIISNSYDTILLLNSPNEESGKSCLYAIAYLNGEWSDFISYLEVRSDVRDFSSCILADGKLLTTFTTASYTTDTTESITNGYEKGTFTETVDLYFCSGQQYSDVSLEKVFYETQNVVPGKTLPLTLLVKNNGFKPITSVTINVDNGYSCNKECIVYPGCEIEIEIDFPVSNGLNKVTGYTINVSCENDSNSSNNRNSFKIGYTDMSISADELSSVSASSMVLKVSNNSAFLNNAKVYLSKNNYENNAIAIYDLGEIPAFTTSCFYLDKSFISKHFSSGDVACFKVVSDREELLLDNNSSYFTVNVPIVEEYEYTVLDNNEIRITNYNGEDSIVIIPDIYDGYTVTAISSYVFGDNIEQVFIPATVNSINSYAFNYCYSLKKITVDKSNVSYTDDGSGILYSSDMKTIVRCPIAFENSSVLISENVETIELNAFKSVTNVETVDIPMSVKSIQSYAFMGSSISSVNYPGGKKAWKEIGISTRSGISNLIVCYGQFTASFFCEGVLVNETDYNIGDTIVLPENISQKKYYSFVEWSPSVPKTMPEYDLEFIAVYEVAESTKSVDFYVDGELYWSDFRYEGEKVNIPETEPTKIGYTFVAWSPEVTEIMPDENLVYNAVFTPNVHQVTFVSNGETYYSYDCAYNESIHLPETEPNKEGYTFEGWLGVPDSMPNTDVEIVAVFEPIVYTATFTYNGVVVGTDEFTVEDNFLDYPVVEEKAGYDWVWENHQINAGDLTVNGDYVLITYTATFIADGQIIKEVDFDVNNQEVIAPVVPHKDGYDYAWEEYEVVLSDITINAVYTPIVYTATFLHNGEVIGTDEFTIEDKLLDYPSIEAKEHYQWMWRDHEIAAEDLTIIGQYIPIVYTATFIADGQIVKEIMFSIENQDIDEPDVPKKYGYTAKWEDYEIQLVDFTVNAVYAEAVVYTATFTHNGTVIGTDDFTVEDADIDYPEIAYRQHYDWVWEDHEIIADNITINGYYVPTTYIIEFVSNGRIIKAESYNIEKTDTITMPELSLPAKAGYHSEWEKWDGRIGNITLNEIYVPDKYTARFWCEGNLVRTSTFTVETPKDYFSMPNVAPKDGYIAVWSDFTIAAKDMDIYCEYVPIIYTATFVVDGNAVSTQEFTVESDGLNVPELPQKAGYIASWDYFRISAGDKVITARYYLPEVNLVSRQTLTSGDTYRLTPITNFTPTEKVWTSSDTSVATVDKSGLVTAVSEGSCTIALTCYGKDALENDIQATTTSRVIVDDEKDTSPKTFREIFDEFFEVTLHDILYNFIAFLIVLFKYAY